MRNLLVLAFTLSTSISTASEASGTVAPTVLSVSHFNSGTLGHVVPRAFVVLPQAAPATAAWRSLEVITYGDPKIAPAPALDQPRTFTLVGPKGARVVSTKSQVYLDDKDYFGGTITERKTAALEVDDSDARIALPGAWEDARWEELDASGLGVRFDTASQHFVLPRCYRNIQLEGAPIGAMTVHGVQYLVLSSGGTLHAMSIPAG
jgi:hypothetical protein